MNWFSLLKWPIIVVVLTGVGYAGYSVLHHDSHEEEKPIRPIVAVPITLAKITARAIQRTIEVVGTLEGYEELNIAPKVEGRVLSIHADLGDEVAPGEPLAEIDDTDYRLAVLEAERGLDLELARLGLKTLPTNGKLDLTRVPAVMRMKSTEENAKSVLDRARRMVKITSVEEMEKVQMDYRVAQSMREHAELEAYAHLAGARLKQAQLDTARQRLSDTIIRVPTPSAKRLPTGMSDAKNLRYIVAARKCSEGEIMRVFPAPVMFRLVIDNPLKLVATVSERWLSEVRIGQSVTLQIEARSKETFQGTLSRINRVVDRQNRTFTVEVSIPNPERKLSPGSFVKARILTRADDKALTVPEEAIVRFAGVVKIFLRQGDKVKSVNVTLGETLQVGPHRWVEVLGEFSESAEVVVTGQTQLADGSLIRVREVEVGQ
jgi:multidrug efflux pump subunit AcrA (membrane-fusion protein)